MGSRAKVDRLMTWKAWARPRLDKNDEELAKFARKLGAILVKTGALDYEVAWAGISTSLFPVDIKDPKKKGHADEFTPRQKTFINMLDELGFHYEIWRTEQDVIDSKRNAIARAPASRLL